MGGEGFPSHTPTLPTPSRPKPEQSNRTWYNAGSLPPTHAAPARGSAHDRQRADGALTAGLEPDHVDAGRQPRRVHLGGVRARRADPVV